MCGGGPTAELRLHGCQFVLDRGTGGQSVKLAVEITPDGTSGILKSTGGQQFVDGGGTGLQLHGLVLGALDGHAHIAHLLGDAGEGLVDPRLRLGRRVGGFDGFLPGAESIHFCLKPGAGPHQLLLFRLKGRVLVLEVLKLGGETGFSCQGLSGEILTIGFKGTLRGDRVTVDLGAHLLGLELNTFATGGHVRHSSAHLAEQLELAFVGVVQGLARVLVLV